MKVIQAIELDLSRIPIQDVSHSFLQLYQLAGLDPCHIENASKPGTSSDRKLVLQNQNSLNVFLSLTNNYPNHTMSFLL